MRFGSMLPLCVLLSVSFASSNPSTPTLSITTLTRSREEERRGEKRREEKRRRETRNRRGRPVGEGGGRAGGGKEW